jgi:hypothetical protein
MSGPEVLIPISFFASVAAIFISRSEIGRAIAHRIRGGEHDRETQLQLDDLRHEVSELRQELSDAQERLDFAERLLAKGDSARQLS